MNKLIIALSLACASACVFADTIVGATPSKVTTNDWFSAKVESSGPIFSKGSFKDSPTDPDYDTTNMKIVIDSELDKPVTFTAEEQSPGEDMTAVSFELDTAIVPSDARQSLAGKNAKVAFAASEVSETAKAYFAWLGGSENNGWVRLAGAEPKSDNVSYNLDVTFDNREGSKKVQFKVDGVALNASGVEWLDYTAAGSPAAALAIDLVGSGSVTSIDGNQLKIVTEVVVVDGGTIDIKEEDMAAFKKALPAGYDTVDKFIAEDAQKAFGSANFKAMGITVGAAYALGLVDKDGDGKMAPVDGGELKATAVAQSGSSEGIKLDLNVTPPTGTGATITYNILKDGKAYKSNLSQGNIVIPTDDLGSGLKVFKVQAVVTPATK